ncbi:Thiolase-like protein [Venustampulla echinocandica]|uniref:Thiolase-like protein n=1 Tax=Venustampulla echinocandica TaxID=2656787 RepID=A0A370TEW3_9HELO|nr:Thiolase-like protein [Venustampulla echinocandica]RDL33235.1 Thiolase-like protein [Venustampulla echinocandica]
MSEPSNPGADITMETNPEPIAIIGMSCRFPGDADTPQGFWDLLSRGESAWGEMPENRNLKLDAYYHPSSERGGAIVTTTGFFMREDVSKYDASFFSMTSAEAAGTDPQQRAILEVTYEALENAGISLKDIAGTATSCHVGAFNNDYQTTSTAHIYDTSLYQATGNGMSMLSNRLSWFYDLRGPSMSIDTACSSSLVALHLAVQGLRSREVKTAIVGGTNIILQPELSRGLTALHFISPDGKCHSFDESANGYGRGEGTGILILKPLCDALRDNDTIRAVIRGSGLNQDGKTPGITMPSSEAQAELIRSTYDAAGLDFDRTAYFEAHGTGTAVGDPIELSSIGASLGANRDPENPLFVGSVKTNLGHLEASAGIAGVIKTVLALENGKIPKVVGLENLNPNLQLDDWHLKLNRDLVEWPMAGLRRASVNSFGYGGANAHVILDDALHYLQEHNLQGNHVTLGEPSDIADSSSDSGISIGTPTSGRSTFGFKPSACTPKLFALSSPEQSGVDRLIETYSKHIEEWSSRQEKSEDDKESLATQMAEYVENFAYTLAERRTAFDWRRFAVADSMTELLGAVKRGLPKLRRAARAPACAYVFTGQGSQYYNMGRELQVHAIFRESVNAADQYLTSLGSDWSVLEELNKPEETSKMNNAEISQPMCTVLQVAIVDLLKHWGITPKAVVGHSSGEIAAAYASGALSQEDSWKVAYFRGLFSGRLPSAHPELDGMMMAVALSESAAQDYVDKLTTGKAVVACINSPSSVTISGDVTAIDEIEALFKTDDVWCRKLKVKTAYHSHHMNHIAEEYLESIKDITTHETDGSVTMFSSVTKEKITSNDLGASYWVQNMLQPVKFSTAVAALLAPTDARSKRQKKPNVQTLVEIGPHAALKGPLNQILTAISEDYRKAVVCLSVLNRGNDAFQNAIETVGQLWGHGHDVNLDLVNTVEKTPKRHKVLTDLPPYPWNHERSHWHESRQNAFRRFPPGPRTDLLGSPMDGFTPLASEPRWTNILKPTEIPWIMDHVIGGQVVLPGSAMIAMAIEACQQILDPNKTVEGYEFRELNFTRALMFQTPDQATETVMQFRPHYLGTKTGTYVWRRFSLVSIARDNTTTEHCNGLVQIRYVTKSGEVEKGIESVASTQKYKDTYAEVKSEIVDDIDIGVLYQDINRDGMQFGPLFRLLSEMSGGVDVGCATLTVPDTAAVMPENFEYPLLIHPTVLDGVFQILFSRSLCSDTSTGVMSVIAAIGSLYVSADLPNTPGAALRGYQKSHKAGPRQVIGNIVFSDSEFSKPYIIVDDVVSTSLDSEDSQNSIDNSTMLCTHTEWKEDVALLDQQTSAVLLSKNSPIDESQKNDELLDQAVAIYIKRAVDSLDSQTSLDEPAQLRAQWLRNLLKVDSATTAASQDADDLVLQAASEVPAIGKTLQTIGSKLPEIIEGSVDAGQVIQDLDDQDALQLTDNVLAMDEFNAMVSSWFELAGFKDANLRIFEFPNRSTSTAISVLQTLSSQDGAGDRFEKYTLAQSDSSDLDKTKTLLKKFSNVDVCAFDLEQGSTKKSSDKYDIVLIPDILYLAAGVDVTLKHAKALLNPGGKLVIGAVPKFTSTAELLLGITEEWWNAKADSPKQQSNFELEEWTRVLSENGFSSPFLAKPAPDAASQASLLISSLEKPLEKLSNEVVILVNETTTPLVETLAANIEKSLASNAFDVKRASLASVTDSSEKLFISLIELDDALLQAPSAENYESVKNILLKSSGVLWVNRGGIEPGSTIPNQSAALGLFRVLRSELPHLCLFNLNLSESLDLESEKASSLLRAVFDTSFGSDPDNDVVDHEYAESNGALYIPRLVQHQEMNSSLAERNNAPVPTMQPLRQPGRPLKMQLGEVGLLDTFRFVDRVEYELPLRDDRVDIEILATGLNFVDVMAALGYVPSTALGAEFAGRISAMGSDVPKNKFHVGQVVVGSTEDCFATNVRVQWKTIQPVPEGMSPAAAATCVIAYTTAYFALYDNGRLKKGDTILIHSAAGGLGQAAVQLAQHVGAIVYATVGSTYKKELLMERYGIPESHIFTSRDTTFAQGVMRETKGRGVDVVLNSTYGEMLRQSWNCLADFGIFVEVGKRDILSNNMLEMAPFIRGCTFSAFNLAQYTEDAEPHRLDACAEVVEKIFKLLGDGHVKPPFPLTVMKISEAEDAFRGLQSGKFAGKIVLTYEHDELVPVMPKKELPLQLDSESTFLLAGGLGGIGKSLAELLITHGAKHIAFISRSGDASDESKAYLAKLRSKDVQAVAYACDITDGEALKASLHQLSTEMPKIKGFVHCAMLLKDTVFENMSHDDWIAAAGPKIQGSWNMHELLPQDLDFFIMLSSTSGIIGNPGQANYAAGNTFQNALSHYRQNKGMKATSIDLSAVTGIGYLAENADNYEMRNPMMKMQITEDEIRHIFLAAVAGKTRGETPMLAQLTTGIIGGEVLRSMMISMPWARDSKFMLLRKADGQSGATTGTEDPTREAFVSADSLAEAAGVVEMALVARLAKALFISPEDINIEQPLHAYGVDSLIAVEVRNWVMKELKSDISILDILSPVPIHGLAMKISEGSKILPPKLRAEVPDKKPEQDTAAADEEGKVAAAADAETASDNPAKVQVVSTTTTTVETTVEIAIRPAANVEGVLKSEGEGAVGGTTISVTEVA